MTLFEYGIMNEQSDRRLHVCFGEGYAYMFPTENARAACLSGKYKEVTARQKGVSGITSRGFIVPPMDIKDCQRVQVPDDVVEHLWCKPDESTSEKGRKATKCAMMMLERGLFRLPLSSSFVDEKEIQIKGIDLLVISNISIEIKCDYNGGVKGSGNLYIQTAERNPLKRY